MSPDASISPDLDPQPLGAEVLRWTCEPSSFAFETTAEIEPARGIVGQEGAVEALRFGLEIHAPGQNVYVRGLSGTGRLSLVRRLLEEIRPASPNSRDYCYVYNFEEPERPSLLPLPRGRDEAFRDGMAELRQFIREELPAALAGDLVQTRRSELERATLERVEALTNPLERQLEEAGLALVMAQAGGMSQPMILPILEGKPTPPERLASLRAEGRLTEEDIEGIDEKIEQARERVEDTFKEVSKLQRELRKKLRELMRGEARRLMEAATTDLRHDFEETAVHQFLDAVVHDVVARRLPELGDPDSFCRFYEVNLIVARSPDEPPPVIVENAPSVRSLVGSIDAPLGPDGVRRADHMSIHAGSLLRADGGVIVMEALEVLSQPGAWPALVRTLRSGKVELIVPELLLPWAAPALKPEPIEVHVKVVLLGEADLYYLLDQRDPDFPNLFKVLADFDSTIAREPRSLQLYAEVIARIATEEDLLPFHASAVASLVEHGARIASRAGKLTARFGRLADIAREAAFLAAKRGAASVEKADVQSAVRRTKARGDGPARRFRELIAEGVICIATEGEEVGQVNGLAVIQAGPLTYGFPTRITASVGPGTGGAVNIERESHLSGAIHTKSFYILGGLLRRLLRTDHALTFEASIAFEQSYGGIDGDSASGAEICCLLSAITNLPIRQGIAMTGAVDQMGRVLPIGAVNEKVEGFYDTCSILGLTGNQGVIIPAANVGDLMLRPDVAEACAQGRFSVWAVARIEEAVELFFRRSAGQRDEDGSYDLDSVLGIAVRAAGELWERSSSGPIRRIREPDEDVYFPR